VESNTYSFSDLPTAPLVPGAVYCGGTSGNIGDDPISKLLPVGNAGGFRPIGSALNCRFVAIVSTGDKVHWPDGPLETSNQFRYFGDGNEPGVNVLDTPKQGNRLLKRAFELAYGDVDARRSTPIFLYFTRIGSGRDFRFVGFAVPGCAQLDLDSALEEQVIEKPQGPIRNLCGRFTVLSRTSLSAHEFRNWREEPDDPLRIPEELSEWVERGWESTEARTENAAESQKMNNSDTPVDLSIRPDASMLAILENISYKEWFAIGELIDNSISSYREQFDLDPSNADREPLKVEIEWDSGAQLISIKDNAAGIPLGPNGWDRVFQLGRKKQDARYLSVFGYGMKAAGLWWSPRIKISSTVSGEPVTRWAVLDRDAAQHSDTTPLHAGPASLDSHGTTVTLMGLNRNRQIPVGSTAARIRGYLASMYRVYLRGGAPEFCLPDGRPWLELYVQGERLEAPTMAFLRQPYWDSVSGPKEGAEEKEWLTPELSFQVGEDEKGNPKVIRGWVGILDKGKPNDAGFLMLFRGKGIVGVGQSTKSNSDLYRPKEIVGSGNTNRRQRFVGEFDVSDLGKSITTDDMFWSDDEETSFVVQLEAKLKELQFWQMAENWRPTKVAELPDSSVNSYQEAAEHVVAAVAGDMDDRVQEPSFSEEQSVSIEPNQVHVETFNKEFNRGGHTYNFVGTLADVTQQWLSVWGRKIVVNLNHPFMQSFFYVPGHNPRGIFSVALSIALAEIDTGESAPRNRMNVLLDGPLGKLDWEAQID
jgi:hypothetical protein